MSFRLFIYYCASWGAAAAYCGWLVGRLFEGQAPLLEGALKGMSVGLCLALGLGLVEALATSSQRHKATLGMRLTLELVLGALGGLLGGFVGQGCYWLSDDKWPSLLVLGWTLTGLLIGAATAAFDYFSAVLRHEDRHGVNRKMRNGLIGGTAGGLAGGFVSWLLHGAWAGVFKDADPKDLWSPSTAGFMAVGLCIGLAVALAQIVLREAWLRVESGGRPGRQLILTRPETILGRAESCDIGLLGEGVEKQHAKIVREGSRWVLLDLGTESGTLLNGQRITASTPLHSGDLIQVGSSTLSFGVRAREPDPADLDGVPPLPS